MKPLESATTPGDANVITWFRPEEDSSGILSIRLRSTSVCAVGSRSIRSSAWPTTSTLLVALANASVRSRSIGTAVRTSTSR